MTTSEQRDTTTSHATTTVTLMTDNETPVEQDRWRKHIITIGPFLCDITVCVVIGIKSDFGLFSSALLFTFVPLYAIRPYRRGFFCGDESIRYPYKHSTVTTRQVYLISLVMLSITIMATEIFRAINLPGSEPFAFRRNASWIVVRVLTYFAYCIFGLLLNLAFTQTTKWSVGRLRPHFLDVCKPNVTLTPCRYPYAYITDYVCQGAPEKLVDEARRSFFSGHAAQSMGTAIFCVIYMQARLPRRTYGLTIVPVFQSLHIGIALLIGLSRLSDNMHHWSDVFVGFLVGCATGYYSVSSSRLLSLGLQQLEILNDIQ
ncbi:unnamed protein product [Toxocara canis]|uniref:AcidPPc domain-containing protein n=1 Tax=Toxocara canis TaxID=6265 RepID=A0A183V7X2_TOXCA|nr:unnamed protein product [Toxocara canis]